MDGCIGSATANDSARLLDAWQEADQRESLCHGRTTICRSMPRGGDPHAFNAKRRTLDHPAIRSESNVRSGAGSYCMLDGGAGTDGNRMGI